MGIKASKGNQEIRDPTFSQSMTNGPKWMTKILKMKWVNPLPFTNFAAPKESSHPNALVAELETQLPAIEQDEAPETPSTMDNLPIHLKFFG